MPSAQAEFLVFDPLRARVLVRKDVQFFDSIPGYPRLMHRVATPPTALPGDADFFTLFPDNEDEAAASSTEPTILATQPVPLPALSTPTDVIQLSSDTE